MSHRDRRDERRRDYGPSRPSERYDSSRRDVGGSRDVGGRSERRRSRSRSPRRRDGKDRDEKRRSRSRSPHRHRSREREYDSRRRDDKRNDKKPDKRDDKRPETNGHEAEDSSKRQKLTSDKSEAKSGMQLDPPNPSQEGEASEEAMMALMGFAGFSTTKGHEVEGNQQGGVKINKQRTWRQYMNRRGGFNRPLDKVK